MDKHDTLLICSNSSVRRQRLRETLAERYHLLEAQNTRQALLLLKQNMACIAAALLDVSDAGSLDRGLLELPENEALLQRFPIIIVAAQETPALLNTAFGLGAADVIPLSYDPDAMLHRIGTIVELHLHKQYLETMLADQTGKIRQANETLVDALSSIIEHRSVESGQHILRIRRFTAILLEEVVRACPEYRLDPSIVPVISGAAALHDIGKIAIPDSILMKPGPLTAQEREIMNTHTLTGCRILTTVDSMGDPEYMRYAYNICRSHHERWDGSGYPDGLTGDDIPICAQVVGLADVYDALTSKRVYKDAIPFPQAVNMILNGECGAFSPKLLECFKHVTGACEALARAYADGLAPDRQSFDSTLPPPVNQNENSLDRVRAKYFALLHYINGLLIEVDLNNGLFHLIYNPYPELSWLQTVTRYSDMIELLDGQILSADGEDGDPAYFCRSIPAFMEQDLRRSTHHLRFRSQTHPEGEAFEVTLIRINPIDASRRTLAILCRRESEDVFRMQRDETAAILSDSAYLCRNDEGYTLVQLGTHIPLLAGYSRQELETRFGSRLLELVVPEDRRPVRRSLQEQFRRGATAEVEYRVRRKDGQLLWILNKSHLTIGPDGQEYINSFLCDITHTKRDCDRLREQLDRYEIILAQTENSLFEWDLQQGTMTVSDTWEQIFGFLPAEAADHRFRAEDLCLHPDDLPLLLEQVRRLKEGSRYEMTEVRIATTRGRYLWCRIRATPIRGQDGQLERIIGIIINIDEEKQQTQSLLARADRDSLTKLLNKKAAQTQVEAYLSRFSGAAPCAMLVIDLDNFKLINDKYGHLFGDAVLTNVAREIEGLFRTQDIVARIGGDEFLVFMRGVSDRALLESRCRHLLQKLCALFADQHLTVPLSCSIGISLLPEHGTSYIDLFRCADSALYQVKNQSKNGFAIYDSAHTGFRLQEGREAFRNTPIESDEEPGLAEDTLVRYAFQRLYTADDVNAAIHDILGLVGRRLNVSRVYVFENSDDNRFCSNTYEWCNEGIQPQIRYLQNVSYEADIPGYMDCFNEQDLLYCSDIRELPAAVYHILAPQNIKSMLHCAIRERGVFRGYVGFDECVETRFWTKEQIHALQYFSEMLSVFLMKNREHERSLRRTMEVQSILDNQNAWIYVIDPDTCRLKYVNARTRALAPEVEPGMCCHRVLQGLEEPCPGCPIRNIRRTGTADARIRNIRFDLTVLAEATLIQWDGEDSCLMTCRELQKDASDG